MKITMHWPSGWMDLISVATLVGSSSVMSPLWLTSGRW